jgi:hypothetical protein
MRRTSPLSLQNDFLRCSCEAKVATKCNHPSFRAVLHMPHFNSYELRITIPRDTLCMCTLPHPPSAPSRTLTACYSRHNLVPGVCRHLPPSIRVKRSFCTYGSPTSCRADNGLSRTHDGLHRSAYVWLCCRLWSTGDLSPSQLQERLCGQAVYYLPNSSVHPLSNSEVSPPLSWLPKWLVESRNCTSYNTIIMASVHQVWAMRKDVCCVLLGNWPSGVRAIGTVTQLLRRQPCVKF